MRSAKKFSIGFFMGDGAFLFISSLIASGLNFALSIVFSRTLSIEDLGVYNLFFECANAIVMLSDIGITVTYINLYNIYKKKYGAKSEQEKILMYVTLRIKGFLFFLSGIGILSYLPSVNFIDNIFFIGVSLIIAAFSESVYQLTLTRYQAEMNFAKLALVRIIPPFIKISICGGIVIFWKNVNLVMLGYAGANFLGAVLYSRKGGFIGKWPFSDNSILIKKEVYFEFIRMWRWTALTSFMIVVTAKFSAFILTTYSSPIELVYFTTAQRFGMIGSVVTSACSTILIPLGAHATNRKEIKKFLKQSTLLSIGFSVPLVVIILAAPTLVPLIFGAHLAPSVQPTQLVMLACLIGMLVSSLSYIFYSNGMAHLLTLSSLVQTIIVLAIGHHLVAIGGAVAAAKLNIYVSLAGALIILGSFIKIYKSHGKNT